MSVPEELNCWIDTLGVADPNSDYFRYPMSKNRAADKEKSPFKEVPVESLFPSEASADKVRALVTKDDDGNLVRAFKYDESTNTDLAEAGLKAAAMLSDFHAMMRIEFTDGW
jgi:hypothetical protein